MRQENDNAKQHQHHIGQTQLLQDQRSSISSIWVLGWWAWCPQEKSNLCRSSPHEAGNLPATSAAITIIIMIMAQEEAAAAATSCARLLKTLAVHTDVSWILCVRLAFLGYFMVPSQLVEILEHLSPNLLPNVFYCKLDRDAVATFWLLIWFPLAKLTLFKA